MKIQDTFVWKTWKHNNKSRYRYLLTVGHWSSELLILMLKTMWWFR